MSRNLILHENISENLQRHTTATCFVFKFFILSSFFHIYQWYNLMNRESRSFVYLL